MSQITEKHLFIGGPGTGKSATLSVLSELGYCCFPEIAREITLNAKKNGVDQLFLSEPFAFSEALLKGRINQYKEAHLSKEKVVYIDRGLPDITAYLDFLNEDYPAVFSEANLKYKYDKIFYFPIWEDIFKNDNERYEDLETAKKIDEHLKRTYKELGYNLIVVPKNDIRKRAEFVIQHQN